MRILIGIVFFLYLVTGTWSVAFTQISSPYFKHITSDEGLASNRMLCIFQDRTGFMWFGTEDGLVRYDAVGFEVFRKKQGLSHNRIISLAEDRINGNLWIGTNRGLNYFNRSENRFSQSVFKLPPNDSSLVRSQLKSILVDRSNHLWVSTGARVYYYNDLNTQPVVYRFSTGNTVQSVFQDSKKRIWVGALNGLYQIDTIKHSFSKFDLPEDTVEVIHLYEDSRQFLWVSTMNNGLFVITSKGVAHYSKQNKMLNRDRVSGVVEDDKGNMYIAVRDGNGLHYLDYKTGQINIYSPDIFEPSSINSSAPTCIYKDRFGNIWIGSFANGVNFLDHNKKPFVHYKANFKSNGLMNNNIRSVFQDSDGEIWIGTRDGGGLSKFSPATGTFVNYRPEPGNPYSLTDDYVIAVNEAAPGKLIYGTYNKGLGIFDKKSGRFYHVKENPKDNPKLSEDYIYHVSKDRYDSIWISNKTTVYTFDLKTRSFKTRFVLRDIRDMLDYSKDEIYFISSRYGLYIYNRNTNKLTNYRNVPSDPKSLSNNYVYSIARDSKGKIWLATNGGGVNIFDPVTKKFKAFKSENGLPNDNTCGVLIDKHDNVWISAFHGLARLDNKTKKIRVYDLYDGLQGNEFERQACFKMRSGEMIFGGTNGFNYFHPDSIKDNPIVPTVVINGFYLFNKPVLVNEPGAPLKKHISLTGELVLNHKQSVFTFDFIALNYTSPEKNQYAYKLEGLEADWNKVGNKRSATYTSLPPGNYIFRVKASNNDGVWNETGASLRITVLPPWWNSWWFRLFIVFAIASAIVFFFYYRTRSLNLQKEKLALMVEERTSQIEVQNTQLKEQKNQLEEQNVEIAAQRDHVMKLNSKIKKINETRLRFFTNVSHEFRTPLTLMMAPVDKLLSACPPEDEKREPLLMIKRNSVRLLNLINELMTFRSIEANKSDLKLGKCDILKFIREIASSFQVMAEQRSVIYSIKGDNIEIEAWIDKFRFEMILFNLISNAFKYTHDGGSIDISVSVWDSPEKLVLNSDEVVMGKTLANCRYFEVNVKDTGTGISQSNLSQIFEQFYRENSDAKVVGSGIGLAMTLELVKLHKGFIKVQSTKGKGSVFTVRIPLEIKHFDNYSLDENQVFEAEYSKAQVQNYMDGACLIASHNQHEKGKYKKHLLIVEDNDELRNFIVRHLMENYRVSEASNGSIAFDMAAKYTPDLVVSDVMMPEMDGIELCKKLKNDLHTCHIPVILLTALASAENQVAGFQTGADDYLSKPFDISVLEARIANLIQSREKLRHLFSASTDVMPGEMVSNSQDEKFIQKAVDIINENISNPDFGVNELVSGMYVSRSLLHKKFVSLTNLAPVDFITTMRLKTAIKVMGSSNFSISEIASQVGYNDPNYFARIFKKHFGKNPKAYMDALRNKDQITTVS